MNQNDNHVTTAIRFAEIARSAADHLDDLPEDEANTYAARRMRQEVASASRLALVYATLATAPPTVDLRAGITYLGDSE